MDGYDRHTDDDRLFAHYSKMFQLMHYKNTFQAELCCQLLGQSRRNCDLVSDDENQMNDYYYYYYYCLPFLPAPRRVVWQ